MSLVWRVCAIALFATAATQAAVPVVYVSRELDTSEQSIDRRLPIGERTHAIERAESGRLIYLTESGERRTLVAGSVETPTIPLDVMDPDVSYDGTRVVFAGLSQVDDAWRIYEVGLDGSGLRQVTSDRAVDLSRYGAAAPQFEQFDDLDPCYLPDGRICFVSTRYPGAAPDARLRTTNLFVVDADGTNVQRITTERFGGDTPAVDPVSGKIVYSRWWRTPNNLASSEGRPEGEVPEGEPGYEGASSTGDPLGLASSNPDPVRSVDESDFPGLNSWFLASVNPDGTDLAMFSGFRNDRGLTQAYRPSFYADGRTLALFIPRTPLIGLPRGDGLREFPRGAGVPTPLGGPQDFTGLPFMFGIFGMELGDVFPHMGQDVQGDSMSFVFAGAVPVDDQQVIVSAGRRDRPQYDLYILQRQTGSLEPLVTDATRADLDPVIARPRVVPQTIEDKGAAQLSEVAPSSIDEAFQEGGTFRFVVENIHFNAPVDTPIATAPPVGQDLTIEFYMAPQRESTDGTDEPFLIQRQKIGDDGRVEVVLPAGVPLFEVLRRPDGTIAQGRDGQIFHVGGMNFSRSNETGRCVGCHAGHTMQEVPEDTTWTNLASSAIVTAEPTAPVHVFDVFPPDFLFVGADGEVDESVLERRLFAGEKLVDRQTEGFSSWVSGAENVPSVVTMTWPTDIEARSIVLHPAPSGNGFLGARDTQVSSLVVETYLDGNLQQRVPVVRTLSAGGEAVSVALNERAAIDEVRVIVDASSVSGSFEGQTGAALSEIEVLSRVGRGSTSTASFLRGDANCDGSQNISDATNILATLFGGAGAPCCEVASDVDASGLVNITDAIYMLTWLFAGGDPLPSPSEQCASGPSQGLGCAQPSC